MKRGWIEMIYDVMDLLVNKPNNFTKVMTSANLDTPNTKRILDTLVKKELVKVRVTKSRETSRRLRVYSITSKGFKLLRELTVLFKLLEVK